MNSTLIFYDHLLMNLTKILIIIIFIYSVFDLFFLKLHIYHFDHLLYLYKHLIQDCKMI